MTATSVLIEATVPAVDDAPAGTVPLAGVGSSDALAAAIASAMTLFGRVEIRTVTTWSEISDLSLDRLVA